MLCALACLVYLFISSAPVRSQVSLGAALTLKEQTLRAGHLAQASSVAELPGAATAEAMSRPEQEETAKLFEEAHGGLSTAAEVMAGGPLPMAMARHLFSTTVCSWWGAPSNAVFRWDAAGDAILTGRRSLAEHESG